jgi:hypothetical protein
MKSYRQAISAATELVNMPNPEFAPGLFIKWAEDICDLIATIYERDYEQVCEDLKDYLDLNEEE